MDRPSPPAIASTAAAIVCRHTTAPSAGDRSAMMVARPTRRSIDPSAMTRHIDRRIGADSYAMPRAMACVGKPKLISEPIRSIVSCLSAKNAEIVIAGRPRCVEFSSILAQSSKTIDRPIVSQQRRHDRFRQATTTGHHRAYCPQTHTRRAQRLLHGNRHAVA